MEFLDGDTMVWRAAYKAGVRFCQDYCGTPLARELAAQLRAGDWRRSLPEIAALAAYNPRGLALALQALRRK